MVYANNRNESQKKCSEINDVLFDDRENLLTFYNSERFYMKSGKHSSLPRLFALQQVMWKVERIIYCCMCRLHEIFRSFEVAFNVESAIM